MTTNTTPPSWPIVGHEQAVSFLIQAVRSGHLHHAYLFVGPAGIGRTTLARVFAQALLCEASSGERPCGRCRACARVARDVHPDVTRVALDSDRTEGKLLSIDRIRELRTSLALRPLEGAWRIAIIDDAERLSRDAADALLKTLEEPPSYAVLVLIAEQAEALPETIRSRCQIVRLAPLPVTLVERALRERGLEAARAASLARSTRGRIALALRLASDESALTRRERQIADLVATLSDPLAAFGLARQLAERYRRHRQGEVRETLQLLVELWRDILWLACDETAPIVHEPVRSELRALARRCGVAGAAAGLRATIQAIADLESNVQARLALDVAALAWMEGVR